MYIKVATLAHPNQAERVFEKFARKYISTEPSDINSDFILAKK